MLHRARICSRSIPCISIVTAESEAVEISSHRPIEIRREQFARRAIPSEGGTAGHMAATADGQAYIACSGVNKVAVVGRVR
jgi:hypothetical protein